jgi:hypothetical protein
VYAITEDGFSLITEDGFNIIFWGWYDR